MKLILCLDEKKGMMFNRRRQSRDALLLADLKATLGGTPLYVLPYSEGLLQNSGILYRVAEDPLSAAGEDGLCFLEGPLPREAEARVDELILYHWNRHYPADLWFTMNMDDFTLSESREFVGSSHEKITKEVWKK
ncbi:MAG: ribonuclease Z [Clostridia bacterium]|nr:ribonuclease Z [Clostridia bacterium]